MKRYGLIVLGLLMSFAALFVLFEALDLPALTDPTPWLREAGVGAGVLGVALLIADVVLPVPSNLVMIAQGALFGVLVGTLLSLAGSVGAALLAFALGRAGGPLLARVAPREAREQAGRLLERWGALAIVVTRPLPLLAETVAVLAGTSGLRWGQVALGAAVGSLPAVLLYALAGEAALRLGGAGTLGVFALVLLAAALLWLLGGWWARRLARAA